MKKVKVALVQMDTVADKKANLRKMEEYIKEAAENGAKVICFPEHANIQSKDLDLKEMSEDLEGETMTLLKQKAKEYGVFIHSGSMFEAIEGEARCYNTSGWIDPEGEIVATYRKLHTFDVILPDGTVCAESEQIKPGTQMVTVDSPFGKIGFATCYDLRFPEQFRLMALEGVTVVFLPASFTKTTGEAHWETLLRARAIENNIWIVAVDQVGEKSEYEAYGNSMLIDPWGKILAKAGEQEELLYGEVDVVVQEQVRRKLPNLQNRRTDCYRLQSIK